MAATTERGVNWYTSRERAKDMIGVSSTNTNKDTKIDKAIIAASRFVDRYTSRHFLPAVATHTIDFQSVSQIVLPRDLISVTTLQYESTAVSASDYFLYPLNAPSLQPPKPYRWVELLYTSALFQFNDTKQAALTLAGLWGYAEELDRVTSQTDGALTASATSVAVDDGTEFDIGQTLKVDSEYMFIRNIATNTLTVKRGVGSTAAVHSDNSDIDIVLVPEDIEMAVWAMAARFMHRGDTAWSDRAGTPDIQTQFTFFKRMPEEVSAILMPYRRLAIEPSRLLARAAISGRYP